MSSSVIAFSLRNAPALIEQLFPVQKLSAESYKEQMAVHGKTLTALGSYWKGRKPLILNKACILGCLLPATDNAARDLEIFEMLMGMDHASFVGRWPRAIKPKEILGRLAIDDISDYFTVDPEGVLPCCSPIDWSNPTYRDVRVSWNTDLPLVERRRVEVQMLPKSPYRELVEQSHRPEEVGDSLYDHIWTSVNNHLGTAARTFPELIEQLGIMRFGHRPRLGDTFCGSGQIPFEAARLGCDVYASDLNPVACMLTWGGIHVVGSSECNRNLFNRAQRSAMEQVQAEIDKLGVESDGNGWRAKVFLYCAEVRCPQTGWMVPLIPSRVVSKSYRAVADLIPDPNNKCYVVQIRNDATPTEMETAEAGTVWRDGKYGEAFLVHQLEGVTFKTKISTLRGDYERTDGTVANRLRLWDKLDFIPSPDDIFQERLYCIQWMRPKSKGKGEEYEFRSVNDADLERERVVARHVAARLKTWQDRGLVPDMRIEVGGPPRYQGQDLIRARGWTYWHHAFNARQLLTGALLNESQDARLKFGLTQVLNCNSRLSRWNNSGGGGGIVKGVFDNQALNTLFNYGCRGSGYARDLAELEYKRFTIEEMVKTQVECQAANQVSSPQDMFVTDPPYGDAVKYEEILDFFIAWLRKNAPAEFSHWVWDSRRSLAIKGEDDEFRQKMVCAYKKMTECIPDNGIQVIMFTHQSGSIWADMANIVWAAGLQVTAAWYVVTEAENILRPGTNVKGTVLLVLRKRAGTHKTTRDELAWEIQEEVESQVNLLAGLNQDAKGLYRDENVFEDADIQMAGYAAALRALTHYGIIDGRDMTVEAMRPRVKGEETFVDSLIRFAVHTANRALVPLGIPKAHWDRLESAERFYLKLLDLEARGFKTLDNYQNFAKAFKVRDFRALMASQKANQARLKSAVEFGKTEMSDGAELHHSVLRAVLYGVMELVKNVDGIEVLSHLSLNIPDYFQSQYRRELAAELANYLANKLEILRPVEASAARILRDLARNQRIG